MSARRGRGSSRHLFTRDSTVESGLSGSVFGASAFCDLMESPLSRPDALARAADLVRRSRELREAQSEVQRLTQRELTILARTASAFFDTISLPEFTAFMLPQSARGLRRIRHRILHRTIQTSSSGTLIRAMLLGRDGVLRLFTARTPDSRELLAILEPGRTLPPGVVRDVQDWIPTMRVPGFGTFEMLEKLSGALDVVEEQIAVAEHRVQVQKTALASGDLSALLASTNAARPAQGIGAMDASALEPAPQMFAPRMTRDDALSNLSEATNASDAQPQERASLIDIFERVEQVAAAIDDAPALPFGPPRIIAPAAVSASADEEFFDEPDEWDDPVEDGPRDNSGFARSAAAAARPLFPVLPPPR